MLACLSVRHEGIRSPGLNSETVVRCHVGATEPGSSALGFHTHLQLSVGGSCQLVEPLALPAPRQAQLLPQRPRHQHAPPLLRLREGPFRGGEWGSVQRGMESSRFCLLSVSEGRL